MSFWDNNKDSFKSAGKATAVGIGRGTKFVAKSGYNSYKKSEAKRNGKEITEPGENPTLGPEGKPVNTVDLSTLPLPPKRNAPAYAVPAYGEASKYGKPASQPQPQPQPYTAQPPVQGQPNQPFQPNQQIHQQPQQVQQNPETVTPAVGNFPQYPSNPQQQQPPVSRPPPTYSGLQAPAPPPRQPSQNTAGTTQAITPGSAHPPANPAQLFGNQSQQLPAQNQDQNTDQNTGQSGQSWLQSRGSLLSALVSDQLSSQFQNQAASKLSTQLPPSMAAHVPQQLPPQMSAQLSSQINSQMTSQLANQALNLNLPPRMVNGIQQMNSGTVINSQGQQQDHGVGENQEQSLNQPMNHPTPQHSEQSPQLQYGAAQQIPQYGAAQQIPLYEAALQMSPEQTNPVNPLYPQSQASQPSNSQPNHPQQPTSQPPYSQPSYSQPSTAQQQPVQSSEPEEHQPEQKPKRPLPDPTLFAPPPVRRVGPGGAKTPTSSHLVTLNHSGVQKDYSGLQEGRPNPPAPPARSQPPIASSFPPPPPPSYRAGSPQTPSTPLGTTPAHAQSSFTHSVQSPPVQYGSAQPIEAIVEKKPPVKPPKPTRKPSHLSQTESEPENVSAPNAGILAELAARNNRLKDTDHEEANPRVSLSGPVATLNPEMKSRPEIKAKPDFGVKAKPEIGAKPEIKSKPELKAKPEIPGKPELFAKPERVKGPSPQRPVNAFDTSTVSELEARFQRMNSGTESSEGPPPVKPKPVVPPKPQKPQKHVKDVPAVSSPPPAPPSRNSSRASPAPQANASVSANDLSTSPKSFPNAAGPVAPPPPPARNYRREPKEIPVSGPPSLDLDLASGWFMNTEGPLELPSSLLCRNYTSSYTMSLLGGVTQLTRTVTVRLPDLAIIQYDIKWTNNDASSALVTIPRFVPSPFSKPITSDELVQSSIQYGEHIAAWTEHNMGNKVATGECWDVAQKALQKGCGNHAFVSTYYHHGYPLVTATGSLSGPAYSPLAPLDEVRRGDILQFKSCTFSNGTRTQTVGAPDHTSIVLQVSSGVLHVGEQNVNGVRHVVKGQYVLGDLKSGTLVVYRAMPRAWGGDL